MKKLNLFIILMSSILLLVPISCCYSNEIVNVPIGEGILTSYLHNAELDMSIDRDYGVVVLDGNVYNIGILRNWFGDWSYLNNYIGQHCYLYIVRSGWDSTWYLDNIKPEWWNGNYEHGKYNYGHD